MRDADAVVYAVLNDGHVKVAADRIHACGPDTAARGAACNDEGVHFQFDENTEERSTVEGAGVAFVDDKIPFLRGNVIDYRSSFGAFEVLGRTANCFCCKAVKSNILSNLPGINDGSVFFSESVNQGFETLDGSPRRFTDAGGPLCDLFKNGLVCTGIIVLRIDNHQGRVITEAARLSITSAADDLAVGRSEDVVPDVHWIHLSPSPNPSHQGRGKYSGPPTEGGEKMDALP